MIIDRFVAATESDDVHHVFALVDESPRIWHWRATFSKFEYARKFADANWTDLDGKHRGRVGVLKDLLDAGIPEREATRALGYSIKGAR